MFEIENVQLKKLSYEMMANEMYKLSLENDILLKFSSSKFL